MYVFEDAFGDACGKKTLLKIYGKVVFTLVGKTGDVTAMDSRIIHEKLNPKIL